MEPMFLDTPLMWAIRLGIVAVLTAGLVVGFLWIRRLTEVESNAQVFRATASAGRRWSAYAIGAGALLLLAVAAIGLGALIF